MAIYRVYKVVTTDTFRGRRTLSIAPIMRLQCGQRAAFSKATREKCGTSRALPGESIRRGNEHTQRSRLRNSR